MVEGFVEWLVIDGGNLIEWVCFINVLGVLGEIECVVVIWGEV